ncbi:hypothetical protein GM708_16670 [Vibrio cholerae]|nr:hypothetical protein [Vibrio cholerae]
MSGFADALEATGAAPGGTTATGDLPSVLTEAAAAFRVATTVAINGALLVVLVGLSLVVPARRRAPGVPSRPGGTSPPPRSAPRSSLFSLPCWSRTGAGSRRCPSHPAR